LGQDDVELLENACAITSCGSEITLIRLTAPTTGRDRSPLKQAPGIPEHARIKVLQRCTVLDAAAHTPATAWG